MTVTTRNLIRFGNSRAVILPSDWIRTFRLKEKQQMIIAYGSIILITPSTRIKKNFVLKEIGHLIDQINGWVQNDE